MKKLIAIAGAGIAALSLSACSQPNVTVTEPAASAPASVSSEVSDNSWENVMQFIEMQWGGDSKDAAALTAPDSPAYKYATYQAAVDEAYRTNGQSREESTFSFVDDPEAGTVTITDSMDAATEYVWSDFEVDSQGRVVSWTGASGSLRDALWTKDVDATVGSTKVEMVGAYKANSGSLFIVLDIKAGPNGALLTNPVYIEDGRSNQPTVYVVPSDIAADTSAYAVLAFDGADFGGKFKAEILTDDYNEQGVLSFKVV